MKLHKNAHPLLKDILAAAEQKGFSQKTVAEKADMAPESLSRIIRTGRMELSTLEKLADTVGLSLFTGQRAESPKTTS